MRELATREYTPPLSYAAAILLGLQFVLLFLMGDGIAGAGVHLLFVAVLALLVIRVDAPAWARLAGYGWAGLALLADLLVLGAAVAGGSLGPGLTLAALALLPGAAWIAGASLVDPGAGRALGVAAAGAMAFSALLVLTDRFVLVESQMIVVLVARVAFVMPILWFVVLARDLGAGKRHWSGYKPIL